MEKGVREKLFMSYLHLEVQMYFLESIRKRSALAPTPFF
jgi:hypothetical protein